MTIQPKTQSFKDLIVWQKAMKLTVAIYRTFGNCKDYSFRDQIQRASVSVMNNVAEGYARRSDKAFKNFLHIAKGSAAEVESMILLARELGYVDNLTEVELLAHTTEAQKLLAGFIRKLPS